MPPHYALYKHGFKRIIWHVYCHERQVKETATGNEIIFWISQSDKWFYDVFCIVSKTFDKTCSNTISKLKLHILCNL